MHCSGLRLRRRAFNKTEDDAITFCKRYLALLPQNCDEAAPVTQPLAPKAGGKRIEEIIPADENKPFDMMHVIREIVDDDSWLEIKALFAREILTGFARIDGRPVGIVANQPKWLGGVLFVDSADKAARFIWLCDAFNVPLLYLADVPGFNDRHEGGAARDQRPRRREDDRRGERGQRAKAFRRDPEGVRGRALRDVRAGVRARRLHRSSDGVDRCDGTTGGGERGVLQQNSRGAGGPGAGRSRGEAPRRVPRLT